MNRTLQLLMTAGAMLSVVAPAVEHSAAATTIVYDNLDPSPTPFLYSPGGSWSGSFTPTMYATSSTTFVPTASGQLDELSLGYTVQNLAGVPTAVLSLFDEISGLPGNLLWQGNVSVPLTFGQLAQATNIGGPTLNAGQTYWLTAAPLNDGVTLHGWYTNNQGDTGAIIASGTYFASAGRFALRVGVTTVPEPATAALGIVCGASLFAVARRRRSTRCGKALLRSLAACLAGLTLGSTLPVQAALIDFETTPTGVLPVDDAFLPSGTPYSFPGLQVSFGFDLNSDFVIDSDGRFELVGSSALDTIGGFAGSFGQDVPDPGFGPQLGNWFLKSPNPGQQFGRFVIQYASSFPVTACSGEIWDIDGNTQNGTTEEYTVQAFDASNTLLATIVSPLGVLDTPVAPLDGQPWTFAFSGLSAGIDHIVITFTGTKPAGIGLAFNNFNPTAVPEPATAALVGLGAIVMMAGCRRQSAVQSLATYSPLATMR